MINKFRIFDKEENEYCEEPDYRWMLSRNGKLYNSENDEWYAVGERYLVEFSTGITDKDGIELFDGDLCSVKYYNHSTPDYNVNQVIRFEDGTFTLNSKNTESKLHENYRSKCPLFSCYAPNRIMKIGTINQNAELF